MKIKFISEYTANQNSLTFKLLKYTKKFVVSDKLLTEMLFN